MCVWRGEGGKFGWEHAVVGSSGVRATGRPAASIVSNAATSAHDKSRDRLTANCRFWPSSAVPPCAVLLETKISKFSLPRGRAGVEPRTGKLDGDELSRYSLELWLTRTGSCRACRSSRPPQGDNTLPLFSTTLHPHDFCSGYQSNGHAASPHPSPSTVDSPSLEPPLSRALFKPRPGAAQLVMGRMEQRRNARAGETGAPLENPPISGGVVRHDSHLRKFGERANRLGTAAREWPGRGLNPSNRLGTAAREWPGRGLNPSNRLGTAAREWPGRGLNPVHLGGKREIIIHYWAIVASRSTRAQHRRPDSDKPAAIPASPRLRTSHSIPEKIDADSSRRLSPEFPLDCRAEKTRRPAVSSSAIPTCENPGVTRPGIEPRSGWWEASSLTARQQRPLELSECRVDTRLSPDLRTSESGRTISLVGGFSRGSPITPALAFWRCSIITSPSQVLKPPMLRAV
ncbi:hypothetical protein PR048_000033 [Dryococelus australis]|uniref:Uncharacterized protein n=1 Tax=Dryococelus australis TaxID=614101 RepID=A0ABQ9IEG2_9NEOP|nr:hypothetical protein PR048_000033 [Dryococelus australis]